MVDSKHLVQKIEQDVFLIWKNLGETPLQALNHLREQEGFDSDIKMTYAGRLDPLAEGQLLILMGEECKNKDKYLGLDKEYEVEILFGANTDTGDVMGIINKQAKTAKQGLAVLAESKGEIDKVLQKFVGKVSWPYPIFSSKTVQGKPLFLWALEGKLSEIGEMPTRESEIYELELLGGSSSKLSVSELREQVHQKINSIPKVPENIVGGKDTKRLGQDFRRVEVLQGWADFFVENSKNQITSFEVIRIRCKCSSGTYMRTLAQKIGEEFGKGALALSIVRTQIIGII